MKCGGDAHSLSRLSVQRTTFWPDRGVHDGDLGKSHVGSLGSPSVPTVRVHKLLTRERLETLNVLACLAYVELVPNCQLGTPYGSS